MNAGVIVRDDDDDDVLVLNGVREAVERGLREAFTPEVKRMDPCMRVRRRNPAYKQLSYFRGCRGSFEERCLCVCGFIQFGGIPKIMNGFNYKWYISGHF